MDYLSGEMRLVGHKSHHMEHEAPFLQSGTICVELDNSSFRYTTD